MHLNCRLQSLRVSKMNEDKVILCLMFGSFLTLFSIAMLAHFNII